MSNAELQTQENEWLKLAQNSRGRKRNIASAALTLAILLQDEYLHADQRHALQNAIDRLALAIK